MDDGISGHVKQLGHELEAVRLRALRTILAKLDLDLVTLDELLDQPNLFSHLVNWLKISNHPSTEEVVGLINRLVKKKDGLSLLLRYDPGLHELSKATGPLGVELIQNLRRSHEAELLTPERDTDSSLLSSVKSSVRSISPKNEVPKKRKKKKKCAFHEGLASSDLSASSLPWDNRKPSSKSSELSSELCLDDIRSQLKSLSLPKDSGCKKVPSRQLIPPSSTSSSTLDVPSSSSDERWPQISWPSPILADSDMKVLKTVCFSLKDREQCREAVDFLSSVVLQDFPPQIFLNETSILQSLLRLAGDKTHHHDVIVKCFGELTHSLLRFFHFFNDFNTYPRGKGDVSDSFTDFDSPHFKARSQNTEKLLKNVVEGISLGDYCGLVLEVVGPDVPGILRLLSYCVPDANAFWKLEDNKCIILKQGIKTAILNFGDDLIKDKAADPLTRLQAHIGIYLLLRSVIPLSSASLVIPLHLQKVLYHSLLDPALQILYPDVLTTFHSYVASLEFQVKNGVPLEEYFSITKALDESARFLKTPEWNSLDDCLSCFSAAIPSLEYHQQYGMITKFVDFILSQKIVSQNQILMVQSICLSLFSSSDAEIKRSIYEKASLAVSSFLGPQKASKNNVPFPELYFVVNKKTLWEIISFGATSNDLQVRNSSENILILLLKCQVIVTVSAWREIVQVLRSVFPLLHSLADMNSNVGRAVVSSLDPDVAHQMSLSDLDILKGNVRFMMSKDELTKSEGKTRVAYLLDIQSLSGSYQSFNLSLDQPSGQSKAPASYEEGSLLRVLEVMQAGSDDVHMLKSAIAQLSLMTEDPSLHILFIDHRGVDLAMGFLKSSVEIPDCDSQHFFMHSVVTLKNIAEKSVQIRLDFTNDLFFISVLLKGIFLFGDDWRILRDASQLLTLTVFGEIIIPKDGKLSFPHVLVKKMKLPFHVVSYGEQSEHWQPSQIGKILSIPSVQKSLGLRWAVAMVEGDVEKLINGKDSALDSCPPLLPVSTHDLSALKFSSVAHNLRQQLDNLSTAYSHSTAQEAIDLLTRYLKIAIAVNSYKQLPTLPWEKSFKRYLTTLPASGMDQVLLCQVLRFLNMLLVALPDQLPWVSKIVKDPAFGFNSLLSQLLVADMDQTAKELSLEILGLVDICLEEEGSEGDWEFVVSSLVQCLSQSHTQQFYSIAIMNKLLKCLLKVTGKKIRIKTKSFWKLLNAFHCSTPNSCMGLTITRLTLLCLCNLLPLHPKISGIIKSANEIKWLWEMLSSSDVVIKAASLELLTNLCSDLVTTDHLLSTSGCLWDISLKIILNHSESNLVREQAVNLCNTIITHSNNKAYVQNCIDAELFKCVAVIGSRVDFPKSSPSQWFFPPKPDFTRIDEDPKDAKQPFAKMTTPTLLSACCDFCLNLMFKEKDQVLNSSHTQGLTTQLFRQVSQWQSSKVLSDPRKIQMYSSICRLLVLCTGSSKAPVLECIPVLVWLLQESSYSEDVDQTELTAHSLMLLASIVSNHKGAKVLFTKDAISTICSAVKSSNTGLACAVTTSLPPLTPFLSPEASVSIVTGLEKYDPSLRLLLSGILGSSNAATLSALEAGLLETLMHHLRETNVNLAVLRLDSLRDRKTNAALNDLSIDLGLITNFLAGSFEAKEKCAALGLADVLHKLWAWCLLDLDLLCSLLQVLVTFTAGSPSAAASVVLTSSLIGVPSRKSPTSNSILHAAISLLSKESYPTVVKTRILELCSHCCQALESRAVLVKSTIITEFLKFARLKRSLAVDEMEVPWLKFIVVFTNFNEGQLLIKNEEFFSQLLLFMSCGKSAVKPFVMAIFRNISSNPNNRQKLIVCERWMKVVANRALELAGAGDELRDLALVVWYLVANNQRGKSTVRSFSLDSRLLMAAASLPDGHPTLSIVNTVMSILKPESRES